jgi:hypothetical protein
MACVTLFAFLAVSIIANAYRDVKFLDAIRCFAKLAQSQHMGCDMMPDLTRLFP